MGKMSRTKGITYEQSIVKKFKGIFPEIKRHFEFRGSDAYGVDFDNSANLRIQAKRRKAYAPVSTLDEIQDDSGIKVVVTKADRKPDVVILYLEDFIRILEDIGTVYCDPNSDSNQVKG